GSRRCRRCLITFRDASWAARHAKRQHPRDFAAAALRGALFVCFVCARPFASSPALLRHQRGHAPSPPFPAKKNHSVSKKPALPTTPIPRKLPVQATPVLAKQELPVQTTPNPVPATPPLACTECGRAFSREGALHRHYIRHARGEL
ncbi:ZN576 protein, partial [Erithacus rubecula]|nr:ZN576 protein [Erithacus rubecula]